MIHVSFHTVFTKIKNGVVLVEADYVAAFSHFAHFIEHNEFVASGPSILSYARSLFEIIEQAKLAHEGVSSVCDKLLLTIYGSNPAVASSSSEKKKALLYAYVVMKAVALLFCKQKVAYDSSLKATVTYSIEDDCENFFKKHSAFFETKKFGFSLLDALKDLLGIYKEILEVQNALFSSQNNDEIKVLESLISFASSLDNAPYNQASVSSSSSAAA